MKPNQLSTNSMSGIITFLPKKEIHPSWMSSLRSRNVQRLLSTRPSELKIRRKRRIITYSDTISSTHTDLLKTSSGQLVGRVLYRVEILALILCLENGVLQTTSCISSISAKTLTNEVIFNVPLFHFYFYSLPIDCIRLFLVGRTSVRAHLI